LIVTMARDQEARTLYSIRCSCGTTSSLDARSFGRPQVCKKCGQLFTVGWGKDAKSGKSVPVVATVAKRRAVTPLAVVCSCGYRRAVTPQEAAGFNRCPGCGRSMIVEKTAPAKTRKETDRIIKIPSPPPELRRSTTSAPAPAKPPSGSFTKPGLTCDCGQLLEIVRALEGKEYACPACGRAVKMEKEHNPHTGHTVIRPRFGPVTPPPQVGPPPPSLEPTVEFVEEDEPGVAPPSTTLQEVFCPCGEALTVASEDAGRNIQCPTCLTLIAVDQLRDPQTGAAVLRVRAIGKMDQDTWSLNDFA
jgi:predicted RNA-binding Zn-ribbon protein involved in translation (DUF1610 family)